MLLPSNLHTLDTDSQPAELVYEVLAVQGGHFAHFASPRSRIERFTQAQVNAALDKHERLRRLVVVKDNWAVDNGFLTPTLKIRREKIEERFGERAQELARQSAEQGQILLEWV